jgi:hypothetical protein
MIGMLIVGYVFAIRSERELCSEVRVNLAYRRFCKLGIEDDIRDYSVFSRARHERFRQSEASRRVFEEVAAKCIAECGRSASLLEKDGRLRKLKTSPAPAIDHVFATLSNVERTSPIAIWESRCLAADAALNATLNTRFDTQEAMNGLTYILSAECQWRYLFKEVPPRHARSGAVDSGQRAAS